MRAVYFCQLFGGVRCICWWYYFQRLSGGSGVIVINTVPVEEVGEGDCFAGGAFDGGACFFIEPASRFGSGCGDEFGKDASGTGEDKPDDGECVFHV